MDNYFYFRVQGRIVGKERPRSGRGHRFYTPKKTHDYERLIRTVFMGLYDTLDNKTEKWSLYVIAYHDSGVRPDGDNVLKSVADALSGLIWHTDKQVERWHIRQKRTTERPYIIIKAYPLKEAK